MRLARQRFRFLFLLLLPLFALAACESTDIDEVGMGGVWDATGNLRVDVARNLKLNISNEVDGSFQGTWSESTDFGQITGTLGGMRTGHSVQMSLFGGLQGTRTFQGNLDDIWAMRGTFTSGPSTTQGSFRRSNF